MSLFARSIHEITENESTFVILQITRLVRQGRGAARRERAIK